MATVTVAEYIDNRSTFSSGDAKTIALITQAECELASFCNDTLSNKAVALLVCHWLTLEANGTQAAGIVGSAKSLEEGDLSISFGIMTSKTHIDPYLALTPYGVELWRLTKSCFITTTNRCV